MYALSILFLLKIQNNFSCFINYLITIKYNSYIFQNNENKKRAPKSPFPTESLILHKLASVHISGLYL